MKIQNAEGPLPASPPPEMPVAHLDGATESRPGPCVSAEEVAEFPGLGEKDSGWSRPPLSRLRYQLPLCLVFIALIPSLIVDDPQFLDVAAMSASSNSFVAASICAVASLLLFRRLGSFPGVTSFGQVVPSVAIPYLCVLVIFFGARLDYSRPLLLLSALIGGSLFSLLWIHYRRRCAPTVYLLPGTVLARSSQMNYRLLDQPQRQMEPNCIVAADLRAEHDPSWERFLLRAALMGIPVFHAKTLQESITGKVEIEHLSENTFGSVIPSLFYLRVKRLVDLTLALALLPVVIPLFLVVAAAIRIDSPGSIFFIQHRTGFRGRGFRMIKFRTMKRAERGPDSATDRAASMTCDDDRRITRLGRFLRRYRIDELPQIVNILRGEMSWIGPRPEADALSSWYHDEIPYYAYRHMVRPGITGWAQVNQGHVTDVRDVRDKLYFDFYYIKYFSAWLDGLILLRTLKTLILGIGAR